MDGLRAVAVVAVVLYHARLPGFSGGFVGVDVFFVISGYLITRILAAEIADGRFSLLRFYERRLRRIAPALLVMTAVVTALVVALKPPLEARFFGESVTFTVLMASNFFFYQETDYFTAPVETFALLHTWSLAVEEQFYLVWPLMLPLLARLSRARRAAVLWGLIAVSFLSCWALLGVDSAAAFYLAPFRFWELAIGAALALGMVAPITDRRFREAAGALGLALILGAVLLLEDGDPFPGLAAAPPVLGAALLIHAGAAGPTLAGRLLSLRPMVFLGLCSYSLYLWHWPVFSFAEYVAIRPLSGAESLAAIAASLVLAVLSLQFVERPFRARAPGGGFRPIPIRSVALICGGVAASLMAAGVFLQKSKGWPERMPELAALFDDAVTRYGQQLSQCAPLEGLAPDRPEARIGQTFCRFGPKDAEPDFLIWGDSHATALFPAFLEAAEQTGRAGVVASFILCPPVARMDLEHFDQTRGCRAQNAAVLEALERMAVRDVFLVASWNGYPPPKTREERPDWLRARLAETVELLRGRGAQTVLVDPVPVYPMSVPSAVYRMRRLGRPVPFDASVERYRTVSATTLAAFEAVDAPRLRSGAIFCDAALCAFTDAAGLPLYADNNHLNAAGAARLAPAAAALLSGPGDRPPPLPR